MRCERKKLVVVGDGASGKTCLLCMFTCGVFPEDNIPKIFSKQCADIKANDQLVKFNLLDTGRMEHYDRLRLLLYPHTNVILMCFSVDNPDSLTNILDKWSPEVRRYCKDVPIILVGNKTDRRCETEMTAPFEEGQHMAQQINAAAYMECSAKNNEGVREIFERAALISLEKEIQPKSKCSIS